MVECEPEAAEKVSVASCLCVTSNANERTFTVRDGNSRLLESGCQLRQADGWPDLDDVSGDEGQLVERVHRDDDRLGTTRRHAAILMAAATRDNMFLVVTRKRDRRHDVVLIERIGQHEWSHHVCREGRSRILIRVNDKTRIRWDKDITLEPGNTRRGRRQDSKVTQERGRSRFTKSRR